MFFWKIFSILCIQYFFVECIIPGLKVNKVDRNLIKRQRQDTLDTCRIFSESKPNNDHQPDKLPKTPQRSRRGKRSVQYKSPGKELEDARRVETIIDRFYEDMEEENGASVHYRRKNLESLSTTAMEVPYNKSGRRFPFAPEFLLGPEIVNEGPHLPDLSVKTVDIPWHKKWINGIVPYFIDPNTYDSQLSQNITKAFDYFERATCIRLQRLKDKPTDSKSLKEVEWLYITNPLGIKQCVHSNAVKVNKGVQLVVFGYDCLSQGEVVHEVMHILGFSHEHTRPDRDQHITVLWNNIKPGYKNYFNIKSIGTITSLSYDYSSILHYPPRAFSKNGKFTILADKNEGAKLGQRKGLSELDVEKVTMVYGNECVDRNQKYLLETCPSVVKPVAPKQAVSVAEIEDYFKDRLWPYGVVTYKIRDKVEFSAEEKQNIMAVFRHIQKETCIQFNDADAPNNSDDEDNTLLLDNRNAKINTTNDKNAKYKYKEAQVETEAELPIDNENASAKDNEINNKSDEDLAPEDAQNTTFRRSSSKSFKKSKMRLKVKKPVWRSPSARRHAPSILILTRSPEPGCPCPEPGKQEQDKEIKINADCFNSVNDLLHLFTHILGLDHQHNMHDRDEYLTINWDSVTPDMKSELQNKLPPAASVGFPYDYLSVMHYPWLQIKDGVANIMYPVWNDGWAMGHWQGLSSTDVQKLNLLYFQQCVERKNLEKVKSY